MRLPVGVGDLRGPDAAPETGICGGGEASGHELETVVGLDHGDPHVTGTVLPVELARTHEGPGHLGQGVGQGPRPVATLSLPLGGGSPGHGHP